MSKYEKIEVDGIVDLDTSRLFDDIDGAIEYLKEVKNQHPDKTLYLDEHWYGYEDNEFRFIYRRLETNEEFNYRVERLKAEEKRIADNKAKEKARNEKLKQFQKLKRELGM